MKLYQLTALGLGGSLLLSACIDSSSEGDEQPPTPLTHSEAHALIESSIQSNSTNLESRLRFLDGDQRLMAALNNLLPSDDDSYCYYDYDEEGNEVEFCEGDEDLGEDETIRIDFMEDTSSLISSILEELPEDLQIEGENQLTYRLNVNRLCEQNIEEDWVDEEWDDEEWDEQFAEPTEDIPSDDIPNEEEDEEFSENNLPTPEVEIDQDCLEFMEREQPRVRLQTSGDGIQAELLFNEGQESLVKAVLNSSLAKVSLDLGVLSRIVDSLDETAEEELGELSIEMSGLVSIQMDTSIPQKAVFSVNVDRAIQISGSAFDSEGIDFTFPATQGLFRISSDEQTPSINLAVDLPKLVQSLSTSLTAEYEYNEETGEETLVNEGPLRQLTATLGGLSAALDLTLVEEGVSTTLEFGLGQESTKISVDGNDIVKVDLNPSHGRSLSFNFDHSSLNEEQFILALASQLHALDIDLKLGLIEEIEAPLGFADELYRIAFTSLNNELPSLQMGGSEEALMKILTGQLNVTAERGDIEMTAEAGMCIVPQESEYDEPNYSEDYSEEEYEEDYEEIHPLSELMASSCQE